MNPAQLQIERMTDEEVDRCIAEKVMGWIPRVVDGLAEYAWQYRERGVAGERTVKYACDWKPSADLNQAIDAAKKEGLERHIQEKSWAESWVAGFAMAWDGEEWEAGWQMGGPEGTDWYDPWMGYSKNPARAVCNAVIAAHEGEK
jgi:hypothetical protein